jgi:hypothetical protein
MRLRVADIEQGLGTSETAAHARAAAMLSAAYHAYGRDLRVPRPAASTIYVDSDLAPEPPAAGELLASPAPVERLHHLQDRNPIYVDLRAGLRWYRARWARLSQDPVASGAPLTIGSTGERVGQLRRRRSPQHRRLGAGVLPGGGAGSTRISAGKRRIRTASWSARWTRMVMHGQAAIGHRRTHPVTSTPGNAAWPFQPNWLMAPRCLPPEHPSPRRSRRLTC